MKKIGLDIFRHTIVCLLDTFITFANLKRLKDFRSKLYLKVSCKVCNFYLAKSQYCRVSNFSRL